MTNPVGVPITLACSDVDGGSAAVSSVVCPDAGSVVVDKSTVPAAKNHYHKENHKSNSDKPIDNTSPIFHNHFLSRFKSGGLIFDGRNDYGCFRPNYLSIEVDTWHENIISVNITMKCLAKYVMYT